MKQALFAHPWNAAAATALLVTLSQLYVNRAIVIAFVPLLCWLFSQKHNWRNYVKISLPFLLVAITTTFYALEYSKWLYPVVVAITLSFYVLWTSLTYFASKYRQSILIPAIVWTVLLKLYSYTMFDSFGVNWSAYFPELFPIIRIFGAHGATFFILIVNALVAKSILDKRFDNMIAVSGIFIIACTLIAPHLSVEGEEFNVGLIQPNYNQDLDWRRDHAQDLLDTNIELSQKIGDVDLIVWPESSVGKRIRVEKELEQQVMFLSEQLDTPILLGSLDPAFFFMSFNAALLYDSEGVIDKYYSYKPVPYENPVMPAPQLESLTTPWGEFAAIICYEENKYRMIRTLAQNGRLIVGLSNNQFFEGSYSMRALSKTAKLSAVENGKYFVRATNTGYTEVVNPFGAVIAEIEPMTRGHLTATVQLVDSKTPYATYGELPLWLLLIALSGLICVHRAKDIYTPWRI